jgi:hypothetical protein
MLLILVPSATVAVLAEDAQDHADWTEVTDTLPTTAGNYVLTENVTINDTWEPEDGTKLDLNGYSITLYPDPDMELEIDPDTGLQEKAYIDVILVNEGVTFDLYDCNGTDQTRYGQWDDEGYQIYESAPSGDCDIITGGMIARTGGDGSGVFVTDGTFNLYGGNIVGHTDSGVYIGYYEDQGMGTFNQYGGTIIGNLRTYGGGVTVDFGTFNLYGGSIQNNYAWKGGGVNAAQNGTTNLYGGSITENEAVHASGGVRVERGGEHNFTVSGDIRITGNIVGSKANNVDLEAGKQIDIVGALTSGASIGVTMDDGIGTFTDGWENGQTETGVFTTDNSSYAVCETAEGELALRRHTPEDFTDVDTTQWYHTAVGYVLERGVMAGNGDGTFAPDSSLTRAELAQLLLNASGQRVEAVEHSFTDVSEDAWYAEAVLWAADMDIVQGNGDGTFAPDDNISRQDLAVMLYRFAGEPEVSQTTLDFADASEASDYAQKALLWANERGIMVGKGDGILDPTGQASRAEAAQMIMTYLEQMVG